MLVTGQTWTKEIPHEPGQSITFRKLSWLGLEHAATVRRQALVAELKDFGDLVSKLPQPDATKAQAQPELYDRRVLLHKGIVAWTYPEEVNEQNVDLLDEETANWAVEQIRQAHAARTPEARKNG
jgi:hypothetical protein